MTAIYYVRVYEGHTGPEWQREMRCKTALSKAEADRYYHEFVRGLRLLDIEGQVEMVQVTSRKGQRTTYATIRQESVLSEGYHAETRLRLLPK